MGALVIIGNGFDLAHGLPTRYSDFRDYLIRCYPSIIEYKNYQFDLNDFLEISEDEFSAELLLSTMDLANGEEWNNFEDALGKIDFSYKFPEFIGNEDSEKHDIEMQEYLRAIDIISNCIIYCTKKWQELFRRWIKEVEGDIESQKYKPKEVLMTLFADPSNKFFTFNYTKTLQILYGIKKVIHIHNRVGQKLIFGHSYDDIMYGELSENFLGIGSSFLDEMVMSFRKDTVAPIRKYRDFFKSLDQTVDRVYSYGFSYSPVDKVYIKMIIERISPNATWYFTEYEASNKEKLRINKVKLRNYGFKGSFGIYSG